MPEPFQIILFNLQNLQNVKIIIQDHFKSINKTVKFLHSTLLILYKAFELMLTLTSVLIALKF